MSDIAFTWQYDMFAFLHFYSYIYIGVFWVVLVFTRPAEVRLRHAIFTTKLLPIFGVSGWEKRDSNEVSERRKALQLSPYKTPLATHHIFFRWLNISPERWNAVALPNLENKQFKQITVNSMKPIVTGVFDIYFPLELHLLEVAVKIHSITIFRSIYTSKSVIVAKLNLVI